MDDEKIYEKIRQLNFEDLLWFIFIVLSVLNIRGDYYDKEYLKSHDREYEYEANKIFTLTIIVSIFIYLYFFYRNYKAYEEIDESQKKLYLVKIFGSIFILTGAFLLLYFQLRQTSFVGTPAI